MSGVPEWGKIMDEKWDKLKKYIKEYNGGFDGGPLRSNEDILRYMEKLEKEEGGTTMVAKAVEIHGKHINLGDKVKVKYEGKETIGVLLHVLSKPLLAVYVKALDCIKVFDVFRIQEIERIEKKEE